MTLSRSAPARSRAGGSAPRRTRARRGARVPHRARDAEAHRRGLSPADARTRALARFGSVPLAADQCRDARGTGFVDDLARDILYAFRTFRRAPLAALTIVATVALGLGLVAVVFTVYNVFCFASMPCGARASCLPSERAADGPGSERTDRRSRGPTTRRCAARPASSPMPSRCMPDIGPASRAAWAVHARHRELLPGARGPGGARAPLTPEDDERLPAGR